MDLGFRDIHHVRTDEDLAALRSDARWEMLTATKDVAKMSRDEAWRYDVWFAARELRRIHLNPYRFHSSKSFDDHVRRLDRDIPKLKDEQIVARLQQMFAMAGDGHTGLRPPNGSPMMRALPIQAFWFEEGVFITAIIDHRVRATLFADEWTEDLEVGDEREAFIKSVRDTDHKIALSLRPIGRAAILGERERVLQLLKENRGVLRLSDKSSPERIQEALGMSKGAFKKLIGALYKEGLIDIEPSLIRLRRTLGG